MPANSVLRCCEPSVVRTLEAHFVRRDSLMANRSVRVIEVHSVRLRARTVARLDFNARHFHALASWICEICG